MGGDFHSSGRPGHPGKQSRWLYAHEFCGAVGSADLPIGRFQRMEEVVTLEAFNLDFGEELGLQPIARRRIGSMTRSGQRRNLTASLSR